MYLICFHFSNVFYPLTHFLFCFGQSPPALDGVTTADVFNIIQPDTGQLPLWGTACRHLYVFLSSTSPLRIQTVCTWSVLLRPKVMAMWLFSWTTLDYKTCLVGLHYAIAFLWINPAILLDLLCEAKPTIKLFESTQDAQETHTNTRYFRLQIPNVPTCLRYLEAVFHFCICGGTAWYVWCMYGVPQQSWETWSINKM